MAEEDVAAPPPADHKRKLEGLDTEAPHPPASPIDPQSDANPPALVSEPPASPDAKRPRLDDDASVAGVNGYEDEKAGECSNGKPENESVESVGAEEDAEIHPTDNKDSAEDEKRDANDNDVGNSEPSAAKSSQMDNAEESFKEELDPAPDSVSQPGDASAQPQQETGPDSTEIMRKIEVPNDKVGVLIGKRGETVRLLQFNSGAKIQIVRDADADMACSMRPVELIGSVESIGNAEKLIRDVIAEADAGGSPALVARGFGGGQNTGAAEQFEMKVPNDKVGLIIGRGGDTIKGLQTRSGARIQLIPQQSVGGDESKERTVRVTGYKRQIDMAVEMIKDVMKQLPQSSHLSGGYRQQGYQSRGGPPSQWGPPQGPYSSQPMMGYDNQQQRGGPYSSQNSHYPAPYNPAGTPPLGPRQGGFGFGWDHRPPHGGNNYDFYGGHGPNAPMLGPHSGAPVHGHAAGPPQVNYNYGPSTQVPPPEYGHSGSYPSQPVPPNQSYGQSGYEAKYDNAPPTHSYGSSQPVYSQAAPQSGYYGQQQYGKPPAASSYGMNSSHAPQPYGNPRPGGDASTYYYPGSNQPYGSQQQVYPSSYPVAPASELPPVQQQTSYPVYPTDGQGQGSAAAYGSYPVTNQQGAGYPAMEPQATAYHHQAASAAAAPQDPNATVATAPSYTQQQPQAGYSQQPLPGQAAAYPSQYDAAAATQQAYAGGPVAR